MKSGAIFLIGIIFTVFVFVVIANIRLTALMISICVLAIVFAGFKLRLPGNAVTFQIGPVAEHTMRPVVNGVDIGEPFPQLLLYKIEERNLRLLLLPALAAVALAVWAIKEIVSGVPTPEMNSGRYAGFYFSTYASVLLIFVVGVWLSERVLLRKGAATLASVRVAKGSSKYTYEFFPTDDVRSGGVLNRRSRVSLDSVAPVFYLPAAPNTNKLSSAFIFHRFTFLERRTLMSS